MKLVEEHDNVKFVCDFDDHNRLSIILSNDEPDKNTGTVSFDGDVTQINLSRKMKEKLADFLKATEAIEYHTPQES